MQFLRSLSSSLVRLLILTLVSVSAVHDRAHGGAFRVLDQGASATGQGTAFAAQANDPSAIQFNPAGMTQLDGVQLLGGTLLAGAKTKFRSANGTKVEGTFGGTVAHPPPSHLYLTANLGYLTNEHLNDWTVGLGVTTPFGISIEYPTDSQVAPVTASVELPLIDIKPTVAWKFNESISVGAGLDIYTFASFIGEGQAQFQQTAAAGNAFGLPAGTSLEANGTDTALGYNASFLWTPLRNNEGKPLVNVAFVYHSGADLNFRGKFLAGGARVADTRTTIELPNIFTGAIAIWPLRDEFHEWKVEADVAYEDWRDFKDLNLNLSNGQAVPFSRKYGDAFVVMVGSEYAWLQPSLLPDWKVAVRAGYVYSESPIPSSTFDPGVPDSAYSAPSVGLGFLCRQGGAFLGLVSCDGFGVKAIGVDLAYQVRLYQTRGVSNNINGALINGEWDTTIHIGVLTLRLNF
ncbi:MAG: fatty acid transporter [Nitrospirales bacterium]|nr:MAG: fatty acid transporter [Nitrospirales bacterium]